MNKNIFAFLKSNNVLANNISSIGSPNSFNAKILDTFYLTEKYAKYLSRVFAKNSEKSYEEYLSEFFIVKDIKKEYVNNFMVLLVGSSSKTSIYVRWDEEKVFDRRGPV